MVLPEAGATWRRLCYLDLPVLHHIDSSPERWDQKCLWGAVFVGKPAHRNKTPCANAGAMFQIRKFDGLASPRIYGDIQTMTSRHVVPAAFPDIPDVFAVPGSSLTLHDPAPKCPSLGPWAPDECLTQPMTSRHVVPPDQTMRKRLPTSRLIKPLSSQTRTLKGE